MSSDRKASLKIDRLIKGCYNYFNNPLSHAVSLRNTLNELKEFTVSLKEDLIELYKLGLEKKRPDLILALFGKSTRDEFGNELNFKRLINKLFIYICYNKSEFLKKLISYPWVRYDVSSYEVYYILTHRVANGLLTHNPSLLTPNDRQKYYTNIHLRKTQEILTQHQLCADVLLYIGIIDPVSYNKVKFYYKNNPELVKRRKAYWTLIFFFAKYVKNSMRDWVYMPGGPLFKRAEKRWNQNIQISL
jgi:hypothetical protein